MALKSGRGAKQMVSLELQGVEELERTLGDVSQRSAHNIMRNTITDMARDVRDEMKQRAPEDEGTLRKAIKAKRERGNPGQISAVVYITHGKRAKHDAFYWHIIEHGSVKQAPVPFIKPSVEAFRQRMPKIMREAFGKRYEKEMQRLAKKR